LLHVSIDHFVGSMHSSNMGVHDQPRTSHSPPPPAGGLGRWLGGTPPGGSPAAAVKPSLVLLATSTRAVSVVLAALRETPGAAEKQPEVSHYNSWKLKGTAELPAW
jgi:hypothetical protein